MIHSLGSVMAIVILISVITPGFLLAGLVITILYCLIGAFYLRASRDLKRIESIQRSPLYQQFGETLSGVSTIRAYGDERRFVRDNLQMVDDHNRPFFYLWACNRWLSFRVDSVGALVSFFAGVFVVLNVGKIDAGLAGLSLTYAITFSDNVLWVVRLYATNEQNMNSVERIREYLEVEQEAAEIVENNRPPTTWPDQGAVCFKNYSTRYRSDLDPVLKNISFSIQPGQKVGIVGRTGAGKSSLTLALFRSLEAETGTIEIDGIDISTIGLRDLRQSITMVPQDPTLFTGSIRTNLDPFGVHSDSEIFAALKRVQLINEEPEVAAPVVGDDAAVNKNIFLDLQSPVSESGNNLSQGQRYGRCNLLS
jgi:ABC-type multidrug transport system fused ATPase/permease subunit